MGEEWGARTPFQFFCDFEGELADAVRNGRREEFKRFPEFQDKAVRDTIPDPIAEQTFLNCKLDWSEPDRDGARTILDWHRRILAVRRDTLLPILRSANLRGGRATEVGQAAVTVRWGAALRLDANLKGEPQDGFEAPTGIVLWQEGEVSGEQLGPWAVRWTIADKDRS